ncbi:MAG: hypothetical protein K0U47_02830 [Epsilonproteobacteria bacterium]|nr:hypothetical protein [Campylobacterota bacterium]
MKNLLLTVATTFALLTLIGCYDTKTSTESVKTEKAAKCGTGKCGDGKKESASKCGDTKKAVEAKCGTGKCGDGK